MIIDIHGHISPPESFKKYPMPPSLADIGGMLRQKDEVGIELTICGSPVGAGAMMRVPGVDNYAQTLDQLRTFHDWLSTTCHEHEGRLKAYVYVNPFGGDDHLAAAADTLQDDAFVGFIANTSVQGEFLDSDRADAFFSMVAAADVPVLLHPPAQPAGSEQVRDFRLVEQVGRFGDVTMGLAALVFAGWLDRYPGLRVIAATAGGAIALLPAKLDLAHQPRHWGPPGGGPPAGGPPAGGPPAMMQFESKIARNPSEYLRQIHVDTASPSRASLLADIEVIGTANMLFGTDAPPLTSPLAEVIDRIRQLPISEAEVEAILGGNARRVFKLA